MEAWAISSLGSLSKINYGFTAKASFDIDGPKFLRITDIQDGFVNWNKVPSCKIDDSDYVKHKLTVNDIVFARTGATTGKSFLIKKCHDSVAASYLIRVRLTDIRILPEYLYLFFQSAAYWELVNAGTSGSAQGGFNASKLAGLEIPLPPIPEQKRIVTILDQAFADIEQARANAEQNLKNARELFESVCSRSIFSTDLTLDCTVFDVAKDEKGAMRTGPFGSQLLKREIVDEGIAVLGIDNAVKNSFQWGAKRFITPEKFEQLSRFEVKPGDVLITIMGTCGRCAIVPENIPKAINTKHICCITLDRSKCLPEYLHIYFLYHPIAREYLFSRAKGAIMAGLNMGIIKELPLVLPSIEEQKKLVSQVSHLKENIERLEVTYNQKLVVLEELKKSILQKAFSGELTALNNKTSKEQAA